MNMKPHLGSSSSWTSKVQIKMKMYAINKVLIRINVIGLNFVVNAKKVNYVYAGLVVFLHVLIHWNAV